LPVTAKETAAVRRAIAQWSLAPRARHAERMRPIGLHPTIDVLAPKCPHRTAHILAQMLVTQSRFGTHAAPGGKETGW